MFQTPLFAAPHPQSPRNRASIAKGKNAKPFFSQGRRGSLWVSKAHRGGSDVAGKASLSLRPPPFHESHQGYLPGVFSSSPPAQHSSALRPQSCHSQPERTPEGKPGPSLACRTEHLCWSSPAEPASLRATLPPTQKDVYTSILHEGKLRSKRGPSDQALH